MTLSFKDILKITESDRNYNLHSHTEFCDGKATMEAFARQAVQDNVRLYGFTPHSPIPFPSPCNMLATNVDRFLMEVDRIRNEYPGVIFLKGMEIDYLGDSWGPANEYFRSIPLDYRIGSVHFIQNQDGKWVDIDGSNESFAKKLGADFGGDLDYVIESFFRQSENMVKAGGFDIVGHLDKIADNASFVSPGIEDTPEFIAKVERLINLIAESGNAVEINTKKVKDKNRFFPNPRYWQMIRTLNIPLVVNSDAHVPALINAGRNEAFELIYLK